MAFLVLAARPAPARLVAAQVAARLGSVPLQEPHQRVVGFGAGAAQQCQPALGVAAIGGDAGQVEQRQRPLGVHRLGRQQLTFGRLDITDPVQRDRAQPAHRHPRRARHLGLQHLGEQAQRGRPAGVGAHRLCHQQLGQQRVGQRRPNVAEQIDQRVGGQPSGRHPTRLVRCLGRLVCRTASMISPVGIPVSVGARITMQRC